MSTTPLESPLDRARLALDGLSVGDAFGERFFTDPDLFQRRRTGTQHPAGSWRTTDDTEMAIAIVDVLSLRGAVDPDLLSRAFTRRYARDPNRGYGAGAARLLARLGAGEDWRRASPSLFQGGSYGNGGAMRAAPIGAFFAGDIEAVRVHGRASAVVTHAHPEGQAGAVAVALAAAFAWMRRARRDEASSLSLFSFVLEHLDRGETYAGIEQAAATAMDTSPEVAARRLGCGCDVSAMDTVPFTLWCAARHLDDYEEALWCTAAGTVAELGDVDTTCAIVGGIVAMSCDRERIPGAFLAAREPLWHDADLSTG
jgi:ADP-ribosylglycohydrolase